MTKQMELDEIRALIRIEIKARYRNIKSYAYARGKQPGSVYEALQRDGGVPKWMLEDFGFVKKVEVVRKVSYWRTA